MPTLNPDENPKSAGLGADTANSVDLVIETHKAVRELLLAMESLAPPKGVNPDAFDAFRGKAQVARRRLEDVDADLQSLKNAAGARPVQVQAVNGAVVPQVHVHVHLNMPASNGGGRSET